MANNVTFQDTDLSTPPNLTVVETVDQGAGVQRQVVKVGSSSFAGTTAATVPTGAEYIGFDAATALPTAVAAGQLVGAMSDKFGRQVVLPVTVRDLVGTQTTTISASTNETTIVSAGGAGIFNDLLLLVISNTSASTSTRIDFRDATSGTILFSLQSVGGGAPVGFALGGVPIPQTTSANNWTAQCGTSTTDIRIYAVYAKQK